MNLKIKRIMAGLTQKELAKKASTSNVTIVKLEHGDIDTVTMGILKRIAIALNSTVQELFLTE